MKTEIILTISFITILFAMTFWSLYSVLDDLLQAQSSKKLSKDIELALDASELTQKDLDVLIDRWNLSRIQVRRVLVNIFTRGITGADEKLKEKLDTIRTFLDSHYESEPIVGLPDNIQILVKQLLALSPANEQAIKQLAASVSEVVVKNRKSDQVQKQINFWSFVITTVSLIIGIASLYYSLNNNVTDAKEQQTITQPSAQPSAQPKEE